MCCYSPICSTGSTATIPASHYLLHVREVVQNSLFLVSSLVFSMKIGLPQRGVRKLEVWCVLPFESKVNVVRWNSLHRNPSAPQLVYSSDDSWTAPSIGWRYGTPFAASASLSKPFQPAQADYGRGPSSTVVYTQNIGGKKNIMFSSQNYTK